MKKINKEVQKKEIFKMISANITIEQYTLIKKNEISISKLLRKFIDKLKLK